MAVRARGRPAVNAAHGLAGASSAGMINAFKLIQPMKDKYPDAGPCDPAEHLRKEIVALSGAHTLGRPRPDRSGCGKPETKYVNTTNQVPQTRNSTSVSCICEEFEMHTDHY